MASIIAEYLVGNPPEEDQDGNNDRGRKLESVVLVQDRLSAMGAIGLG